MTSPKVELSRQELSTWVRFMFGSRSLFHALDRRLRDDVGLSMDDFDVLAAIERRSQPSMGQLADVIAFSPSRLTHTIRRMEDKGWVARTASCDDARVKTLSLTTEGKKVLDEAWPHHAEAIRELFLEQLPEGDRNTLEETFTRIRHASQEEG